MLTIPRKTGESIMIGDDIVLTVIDIQGDKVRFHLECPDGTRVQRQGPGKSCDDLAAALTFRPAPPPGSRRTR